MVTNTQLGGNPKKESIMGLYCLYNIMRGSSYMSMISSYTSIPYTKRPFIPKIKFKTKNHPSPSNRIPTSSAFTFPLRAPLPSHFECTTPLSLQIGSC